MLFDSNCCLLLGWLVLLCVTESCQKTKATNDQENLTDDDPDFNGSNVNNDEESYHSRVIDIATLAKQNHSSSCQAILSCGKTIWPMIESLHNWFFLLDARLIILTLWLTLVAMKFPCNTQRVMSRLLLLQRMFEASMNWMICLWDKKTGEWVQSSSFHYPLLFSNTLPIWRILSVRSVLKC